MLGWPLTARGFDSVESVSSGVSRLRVDRWESVGNADARAANGRESALMNQVQGREPLHRLGALSVPGAP